MKVIFLTTSYPRRNQPNNGIFIHRQAKALARLGVEVHVVIPVNWYPPFGAHTLHPYWLEGFRQKQSSFTEYEGIQVHNPRVFVKMPSRFFHEDEWQRMGRAVGNYIKNTPVLKDADWIYAHFICHEGYAGAFASDISNIPLAVISRGDDVHAWPEQNPTLVRNIRTSFKKANLVLANNVQLGEDTLAWIDEEKKKVHCVYNGVDPTVFYPPSHDERINARKKFGFKDKVLVCIATPVILKGWIELLDALKNLNSKFDGWKLAVIASNRPFSDAIDIMSESRRRGIENKVIHFGEVDSSEVARILHAADAFVLPSYNEGISNAVVEALACGLPVIATNVGGHREVITSGLNGVLIEPRNIKQLQDAIERIVVDDSFRTRLSNECKKIPPRVGTYESNANVLLTFLNEHKPFTVSSKRIKHSN